MRKGANGSLRRLWVLMATIFVDMIGFLMVLPLLAFYAERFGAGGTVVGALTSAFAVTQLACAPLWGRLSDRYGRRPILLIGLTASAAAYLVFGLANALWLLFVSRLIQGAGAGTIGVVQAYVSDVVPPNERSKALGWTTAAASAGVMVGPLVASMASYFGPEAPGLVAAALCLMNVLFTYRWLPESRGREHRAEDAGGGGRSLGRTLLEVFRHPGAPVSSAIWLYALAMLAFMGMNGVLSLYLEHHFGITVKTIGWFYTYVGFISVVMRALLLGPLVEHLGEGRAMRLGALSMALGFLCMPFPEHVLLFLLAATLIPVGTALFFPTTTSMVSQRSPQGELGQTLGVQQTFRGIASIVGPLGTGAAFEHLGLGAPFWMCGAVMVLALLLAARVSQEPADIPAEAVAPDPLRAAAGEIGELGS